MTEYANPVSGLDEPTFVPSPRVFVDSSATTTCRLNGVVHEEFCGDHVVCPTCRGAGRIPRETDQEIMALIPLSDKRLRPRRTTVYVLLAVILCFLAGGLLLFFLFPRPVILSSDTPPLVPTYIYSNLTYNKGYLLLTVMSEFNVSNYNFFSVAITSLDVSASYADRIVGSDTNDTKLALSMRSSHSHYITLNVTFTEDEDFIVKSCSNFPGMMVLILFRVTVTVEYMLKSEQISPQVYQYVHCNAKSLT